MATVRKILIFDNCRSGGFSPDLVGSVSSIAVLAGCNEGYFTFATPWDGTGFFTNRIVDGFSEGLDGFPQADNNKDGTVTLDELDTFIKAYDWGDLIGTEVLLMAKNNVDGVYDADPLKNPAARKFDKLTHLEAINRRLEVMDATALSLCLDNKLPIIVFDIQAPGGVEQAVTGEPIGTLVSSEQGR